MQKQSFLKVLNLMLFLVVIFLLIILFLKKQGNFSSQQQVEVSESMSHDASKVQGDCISQFCNDSQVIEDTKELMTIFIPVVSDKPGVDLKGPFGCDSYIEMIPYEIPKTTGVIGATLRTLFDLPEDFEADRANIAGGSLLTYDYANVDDKGHAQIYLNGVLGVSHCAIPALKAQIDQAVLQFPTITSASFYIDGELYDWCRSGEADGEEMEAACIRLPQPWVIYK